MPRLRTPISGRSKWATEFVRAISTLIRGRPVAGRFSFRDHHCYTVADLERIQSVARSSGAVALITTAKDRVRLAPLTFELPILTAGLRIEIGDQEAALDWLAHRLAGKAACPPL